LEGEGNDMLNFIIEALKVIFAVHQAGTAGNEAFRIKREMESEALVPRSDQIGGSTVSRRTVSTLTSGESTDDVTRQISENPASPANVEARNINMMIWIIGIALLIFFIIFKRKRK
jgi:hypothetical protein